METSEVWRWIWLVVAMAGIIGEIVTAGTFFLLPFGIAAAVACGLAFAGVGLAYQWLAFVVLAVAGVAATRPLARRLDVLDASEGIGARRWIGQNALVLDDIPPGDDETGLIRVGREEWRAQTIDGTPVSVGSRVRVVDVTGTRLVVAPLEFPVSSDEGETS